LKSDYTWCPIKISNIKKYKVTKMSNKFQCKECGSGELAFNSYVKCIIPVIIREEGRIEYLEAVVDSDDYIQNTGYYCCSVCDSPVGDYLQTERDLLEYLSGEVLNQKEIQENTEE
jgi:hypothetical protein